MPPPPWSYLALAGLRCLLVVLPGYIHPDEFFQGGQELFAPLLLGVHGCLVPWEFGPAHALRSVAFPFLVAGLPFILLKQLVGPTGIHGRVLLYLPRLVMVGLSFVQDWCILQLLGRHGDDAHEAQQPVARRTRRASQQQQQHEQQQHEGRMNPWAAATLFAASWPTLLLGGRPFSNTLEAVVLALTLYTYFCLDDAATWRRVRLGACFGLGCFVRFTFPAFALPLGLAELWGAARPKKDKRRLDVGGLLGCILVLAAGVLLAALPMVLADSWFYAHFDGSGGWRPDPEPPSATTTTTTGSTGSWRWWRAVVPPFPLVICPLNALRYNASPDNLATHGLHPRVTHALVNLPLLFSIPGLLAVLRHLPLFFPTPAASASASASSPRKTYLAVVLSGLGLLSLAPHQEPRFLLPLGVPLTLLFALTPPTGLKPTRAAKALGACMKAIFVVQSLACLLLFGGLHQAGLVPALLLLEQHAANGSSTVIFHKTYMPPRFLLAGLAANGKRLEVVDLSMPDAATGRRQTLAEAMVGKDALVVAPASLGGDVFSQWEEAFRVGPHLSMEDPPKSWRELALVVYREGSPSRPLPPPPPLPSAETEEREEL